MLKTRQEKAQSTLEYIVVLTAIVAGIILVASDFGKGIGKSMDNTQTAFGNAADKLNLALPAPTVTTGSDTGGTTPGTGGTTPGTGGTTPVVINLAEDSVILGSVAGVPVSYHPTAVNMAPTVIEEGMVPPSNAMKLDPNATYVYNGTKYIWNKEKQGFDQVP